MKTLTEHERCAIAREYRAAVTLADRRAIAARVGLTLAQLRPIAR